ncbi:Peptidase M20 domain-containing protein 2 Aminoacylase-1-like protein 2 [Larimichthys crocea]|uniref:Peptidase M20 domain-containing protein 2 n=1 Tax=Larimichthys crocea TaxID=215358 RepID=A0A0F8D0U2_LARCR|nr:peptidase M20 domain-containing protein 2 [Larimichthys crocea]KAE8278029.1 Peptidase M20 domain-containing protein 2 Aminoacylase-1-like protein 2 [Larimichthys crocea]
MTAKMADRAELLLELKQRVSQCIEEAKAKLHTLSKDIWSCPELAYEESRSHDTLVAFFSQEEGWKVDSHFKLHTAFRATWGAGGSEQVNVGFLCEYDALPGIGHACGHNLIAEVGAAAALGLKAVLEDTHGKLPVQVQLTVLGTPAEEDGGGKIDLLRKGAFDNMDVVFMAHPLQDDAPYLPLVAEHDVTIKYHGKASHASAYPWEGINALDAAVLCYNNLSVLRQQMKPDWRVHGIIKHGGVKPNIIPAYAELEYYLRTPSRAELHVLKAKAEMCFRSAAVATGCEVEVEYARNAFDNILRNTTLEDLYENNGKALGMEFTTDEEVLSNASGSTDFGNVSFVVPGIHPYFYIGSKALNHTEEYTVASGDDRAQFFTLRTAKALAMTALDVLLNPELLQRVKQEFTEAKLKEDGTLTGEHTELSDKH